jgi:hypothetical protein
MWFWICSLIPIHVSAAPLSAASHMAEVRAEQEKKSIEELLREVGSAAKPDESRALAELLKQKDVREGVLDVLRTGEEPEVLGGAVLVLGRSGKRGQNDLKAILSAKARSSEQDQVLRGLGVIGAEGAWLQPEVLELVAHGLEGLCSRTKEQRPADADLELRTRHALLTLGYIGADAKKSLALVEKMLALELGAQDASGMECRMAAVLTLWRLSGAKVRALELFGLGLESAASGSAVFGLGEMGAHAASLRPRLQQLLGAADPRSRGQIADALDKIDGKKPVVGPVPKLSRS